MSVGMEGDVAREGSGKNAELQTPRICRVGHPREKKEAKAKAVTPPRVV